MSASQRPLGLRTVIYHVTDLDRAKQWYSATFGLAPYFDQPYYVGFNVGGFELGLDPDCSVQRPGAGGATAYWGVSNAADAVARFVGAGGTAHGAVRDVGDGIRVATVADPFGNVIGLIENPHFALDAVK
jgi:predicted enzyme related to lactoylglutathione lyase